MRAVVRATPITGRARGGVRRGALVSLAIDGVTGVGEASPLPGRSRESLDDVLGALARLGGSMLVDPSRPMDAIDPALPPSLRFALETAAVRLARALAGVRVELPPLETQVLGDDLGSIDRELDALARGARSFKLKIRTVRDTRRVTELRERAPDARIRVDANRAFSSATLVPWDTLLAARVEWIEEPTPHASAITQRLVPIALDESLDDDRARALDAVCAGRIAALVLKPTLLGAREVLSIAALARAHGVRTVVSHAFESEVGRLAALELAAAIDPSECHGLERWPGIETLRADEGPRAARALV